MRFKQLHSLATRFPGKRVLVVGDVMLDEFIWGEVQRISPEAPVPVVEMHRRTDVPGGAANTAGNIASLKGEVMLGGVIGQDPEAQRLIAVLREVGVDTTGFVVDPDRPTTTKTRIIAHSQQVVRLDRESRAGLPEEREDELLAWVRKGLTNVDVCLLSDYGKGVVTQRFAAEMINLATEVGIPIIVDPKGTDFTKYRRATVIKPNLHEVELVLNRPLKDESSFLAAGEELSALLPETALLISRGAQGMSLFRTGRVPLHISSVAKAVFDVTGAGDTVVATMALSLAAGAKVEEATQLANRAAGIAVSKVGTAAVTHAELRASLTRGRRMRSRSVREVTK